MDARALRLFGCAVHPHPTDARQAAPLGFRFGAAAYLTDHSEIPEESKAQLRELDVLFLDALRHRPHPTHSTVERAWSWWRSCSRSGRSSRTCATTCRMPQPSRRLPPHVRLAYDGLQIEVAPAVNMRVARSLEEAAGFEPCALTIGNFDGVHIAHTSQLLRAKS